MKTPVVNTFESTSRSAAGIVPSANRRFALPEHEGEDPRVVLADEAVADQRLGELLGRSAR